MIATCDACDAELATDNPLAWLEHMGDGSHVFHWLQSPLCWRQQL